MTRRNPKTRQLLRTHLCGLLLLLASGNVTSGGIDPQEAAGAYQVTGSITYRQRIALPPGAEVEIQLLDVSLMDVAARLISEQTIKPEHSVPIAFALPYDPGEIDERMTYAVRATIRHAGKLLFVTDRSYPVLTRGNSDYVELILVQP